MMQDKLTLNHKEIEVLDAFVSDDGKHVIRWGYTEGYSYPMWVCKTHSRSYYHECCLKFAQKQVK